MRQCIACGKLFEPDFSIVCKDCEPLWGVSSYASIIRQNANDLMMKTCPVCGNEFWWSSDKRRNRKYCSSACAKIAKIKADRRRSKEKHGRDEGRG